MEDRDPPPKRDPLLDSNHQKEHGTRQRDPQEGMFNSEGEGRWSEVNHPTQGGKGH